MCFCNKSLDASAENELQVNKLTALTGRGFYGDTLTCNYSINGVRYSADLNLFGSVYSESSGSGGGGRGVWSGINADPSSFFTNSYEDYDVLLYATDPIGYYTLEDVTIYGCDTYFGEYARGCFAASVNNGLKDNPVNSSNLISAYPDNYFDTFHAISANYSASSNLADYYGVSTIFFNNDYNIGLRMIPYEFTDGGSVQNIHFDSVGTGSYGHFIFAIICPYVGGSMANRPPVTATTTATTTASNLGSFDINVTVDVDLSPVVSEISGVAGEVQRVKDEVTGIATDVSNIGSLLAVDASETAANMSLEPLGTLSSIDYDHILDDADEVMEDLPNALVGTASLWSMISALVDTNAIWLWLIPLCMLLCFLSVMLWRS